MAPFLSVYLPSTLVVVDDVADDVVAVAVVVVVDVVREFGFHPKFIRSSRKQRKRKIEMFRKFIFLRSRSNQIENDGKAKVIQFL